MSEDAYRKTKVAFYWSRILDTPFWAVFLMLPYILLREFDGTPLQLSIMIALKPLSSILSMYWSSIAGNRRGSLISNVVWGGILRHLPFFFFPFIENSWMVVIAWGFHMVLLRGSQPAWMEIFRINIPVVSREKVYAYGSALGHIGDILLPLGIGYLLDGLPECWRWIFPLTAFLSLLPIFFQMRIPIEMNSEEESKLSIPIREHIINPWKETWKLLSERMDFTRFQVAFMFSGTALMIIQPATIVFCANELNLSYKDLSAALIAFKGIGFALTSPLWASWINKTNIYRFTSFVSMLICIFPVFVMVSKYNIAWLYLGYLGYGVMQAGSSLSWNMSGPIFAGNQNSSLFTTVNIVSVGLRGCVAPAFGGIVCSYYGPLPVFILGIVLSLVATERLLSFSKGEKSEIVS